LATVYGFARTLERVEPLGDKGQRYVELMIAASSEMADLLDRLHLVARIERGAYEPPRQDVDSLQLAQAAAGQLRAGGAAVQGQGAPVTVDREWTERSLAALADCMIRHGDADEVEITVSGVELRLSPVADDAGPIVMGDELRDLGAACGRRLLEALGGSVSLEGEALLVRLPAT
jgi:signal transduction histidine kinase